MLCLRELSWTSNLIRKFSNELSRLRMNSLQLIVDVYSFTSRQFGYSDVKEYYKDACLVGKINNIKIPVLALNAEDDPFQVCASNFHR